MKKIICVLAIVSISFFAFSFEWPIESTVIDTIKSFFGQIRGERISTSVILEKPESTTKNDEERLPQDVKSCEEGRILTTIYSIDDDNDFFPSTLGNAVIIAHEDNIISIYGNLLEDSIPSSSTETPYFESGIVIGQIGNSAWQESGNGLEFGIVDSKNNTAINPRVFLPRIEKESSFAPSDIILEGKDGKRYELTQNKTLQAGTYKFYQKRNEKLVPFKISISLNGDIVDEYSFNVIFQDNNNIFINGKTKKYPCDLIYTDNKYLFIGETKLTSGKSVISFENTNHLGEKRLVNYNITVY